MSCYFFLCVFVRLPRWCSGKEPACQRRRLKTQAPSLGREDPLEEGVAAHSSVLARETPWTQAPGGLWSQTQS